MSEKYKYLHQYIETKDKGPTNNYFDQIKKIDVKIKEAEKRLGYKFPSQIKEFWLELGCGFLKRSHHYVGLSTYDHDNYIFSPTDIADIILLKEESELILPDVPMLPEAIPFFAIGQSYDFLAFLRNSSNPNAVYDQYGNFIEKDFQTFIHNLYYKSPTYYLDVYDIEE